MFSLSKILTDKTPTINILDIGAMLEGEPRYNPLFQAGYAKLTLVEPNHEEATRLRAMYGSDARILESILGDGSPGLLNVTHYPGCNSMFEPDPSVIDKFASINTSPGSNFELKKTETVETVQLDQVFPKIKCDYIKIDVQGSELNILNHGEKILKDVFVIESEVEFLPIYKKQPLFGDLQIFMRAQGFVLHKFIDVASRCFRPMSFSDNVCEGMSQLLWADAIFVKSFTDLKDYSNIHLLKTAYIMHDIYGSFDLAFFLLSEHDKRTQTSYSLTYAKQLATFPELPKFMLNFKEFV